MPSYNKNVSAVEPDPSPDHEDLPSQEPKTVLLSSQWDIPFIDQALLSVLEPHISETTKYLPSYIKSRLVQHQGWLLQVATFWAAIGCNVPTPAMLALGVHPSTLHQSNGQGKLSKWMLASLFVPHVWTRVETLLRDFILRPNATLAMSAIQSRSRQRQRRLVSWILTFVKRTICTSRLFYYCYSLCSSNNAYIPMNMAMGLAGVHYIATIPSTVDPASINYMYTHRRMMFSEMQSCLSSWLSTDPRTINRVVHAAVSRIRLWYLSWLHDIQSTLLLCYKKARRLARLSNSSEIETKVVANNSCAKCKMQPIRNPYCASPCGHVYCYVCLYNEFLDCGIKYTICHLCGAKIESSYRC